MSKKVSVPISVAGVDKMLKAVEDHRRDITRKSGIFLSRMAEMGATSARAKFSSAIYAGENDVKVSVEKRSGGCYAVVATGNATLFIEFGTGVTYPDDHPEKSEGLSGRGEYGKGRGKRPSWGYYGKPGNAGSVIKDTPKGPLVITSGNPANRCMYDAKEELKTRIREVAMEVFG